MKVHNWILLLLATTAVLGCSEYSAKQDLSKMGYSFSNEALLSAIDKGDIEALKLFVAAKIDLNPLQGQTPLHRAVVKARLDVIDFLLANGAKPNNPSKYNGDSEPLDAAMAQCSEDMTKVLVAAGADINRLSVNGNSPLAKARVGAQITSYKCNKVARVLEAHGAKCVVTNNKDFRNGAVVTVKTVCD